MKRGIIVLVLMLIGNLMMVFAAEADIPASLRNNRYFTESLRLNNLARLAFGEGDYDTSRQYSEEAIRYAALSDEYVHLRLKIMETDNAIAAARTRLDLAASLNVHTMFPDEYNRAQVAYGEARNFRAAERWDDAIDAANRVLVALALIDRSPPVATQALPARYTVRTWENYRDCLWNIAGEPWAYNDPYQWTRLYDANRSKMPERDNPDLINPGMIIEIPSIRGEVREGMWNASADYSKFLFR